MTRPSSILALVGSLCGVLFLAPFVVVARDTSAKSLSARRLEAIHRWESSAHDRTGKGNARRATDAPAPARVKNITFSNSKAARACAKVELPCVAPSDELPDFYVDGGTIPLVNFDVGPSWSGLIPISSAANEERKVRHLWRPPGPPSYSPHFSAVLLALSSWSRRKSR
jgi:carboxypeptidase D